MAQEIKIGDDLYDLLTTHNFDVEITDERGQTADPANGVVFKFDYQSTTGKNYGTVVLVAGEDNELMLFYGDNLGRGMEPEDKDEWFKFMKELKDFSTRHNFHTFSPKNINALKRTMAGMAAIKEGLFEGYYGTRRVSYMGEATEARLVIRHNRMIGEDDKRYRYVESLFIETADGERFKLPFVKLAGGRAMLEHVRQGGRPYDIRGQHITETVNEMAVLSRFRRAQQGRMFEGNTRELVENANAYYDAMQLNLKQISSPRGYQHYFESWSPAEIGQQESLVEDLRNWFVEQTLDTRIEQALPTLAKIQSQGNAMKEAQIFENWANQIMEGTWALPDTPEAQEKLNTLMSSELIVGPDAVNATELLYDVIGDDELFDILSDLAQRDPRANIWDDSDVQARLAELGIQTPQSTAAEPADVAQDTAPGQQGVAEDLNAILRHAGVPVKESRIHENSEYTYEIVAKVLAREKPGMATDKSNDDFYSAVYHELIAIGMTPKAARNLISYDEDFISDVATAYNHYQDRPGLDENNSEMVMPEADNISTFEVMSGFDAPVAEGSCNMTTEGEYCPEHGLAECAMEEGWKSELAGGTAGGVAGTLAGTAIGGPVGGLVGGALGGTGGAMIGREMTKEDGKDPMDHRGAVTDSFYESQQVDELARIKSLLSYK